MRRLAIVVAAVALVSGLTASPASAQTDAVSVARALIAAENAHNVSAAVALFAPGAVVNLPTGVFVGRTQITGWQQELAAGNFRAETTPPVAVTPEVVTFSGTVAVDLFRSLGLATLDSTWQITISLGQITTFNFNFTPAAAARLAAALAGAGAPAATAAPAAATAGRSLALTGADLGLAVPAALAVVLGALLLAATSRRRRSGTVD